MGSFSGSQGLLVPPCQPIQPAGAQADIDSDTKGRLGKLVQSLLFAYGTRPEAIKLAPLIQLARSQADLEVTVLVTGQHPDLLEPVHEAFGIRPDRDLGPRPESMDLGETLAWILAGAARFLCERPADALVVQGDTASTLACALAGFYAHVPVVHLEAGLRTADVRAPHPEEMHRRAVSQFATLHLAPTQANRAALIDSGIASEQVVVTGNTGIDALLHTVREATLIADPQLRARTDQALAADRALVTFTMHRRESWGPAMTRLAVGLADWAVRHPQVLVICPLHPNPIVRESLVPALGGVPNVLVVPPLDYPDLANLLARSTVVLTDSGGLQEECPSLGIPVLILREQTERLEAVESGWAAVVGTDPVDVLAALERVLAGWHPPRTRDNPFGDGRAAPRALAAIRELMAGGAGSVPAELRPHVDAVSHR